MYYKTRFYFKILLMNTLSNNINTIEYIYDFYKNQKTQIEKINKIKNWFIEIEKSPKKSNVLLVTGYTGIGKCLNSSSKILLNSGFLTDLYNINIGDYVLDHLNTPRKVLKLCRGIVYGYYKIKHKSINYSYDITPNHNLYLYNTIKHSVEIILADNFYTLSEKSIYKGINTKNELFDLEIEFVNSKLDYIGITVENNIIVLQNDIITHNSNIINIFLQETMFKTKFDVLEMGRLFEVFENNTNYTTKDFINKIVKQKNVNKFDFNMPCKNKLILMDSFEEYFNIHKNILRDFVDKIEFLNMPIIIVSTTNYFNDIEKKIKNKLLKISLSVDLDKPNNTTIGYYLKHILKLGIDEKNILRLINFCQGDLRNLNNMIEFQKIGIDLFCKNDVFLNINDNYKDLDIEFDNTLTKIKTLSVSEAFNQCSTEHLIFGMLTYQNYIYNDLDKSRDINFYNKKYISDQICFADKIEKVLFKTQQWCLLNTYIFFSTIYPWKLLEQPKKILPSNTLQKFMNTKKRNKKYNLLF